MIKLLMTKRFCTFDFVENGEAERVAARSSSTPTASTSKALDPTSRLDLAKRAESKWLSDQLVAATLGVQNIALQSAAVLEVLEPHMSKCRETRSAAILTAERNGARPLDEVCALIGDLQREEVLAFDTASFPLKETFCAMLFGDRDRDRDRPTAAAAQAAEAGEGQVQEVQEVQDYHRLEQLHLWANGDLGQKKARGEKRLLLAPLLDPRRRHSFQQCYDDFVLRFILPSVERTIPLSSRTGELHYQSFPCTRLVRPGEFSIGPHADCNYGFQAGNVNFYLPLVTISGSNSLAIESAKGKEDWHFLQLEYGQLHRFHGAICAHFTPENTSPDTRVSFDFRVICGKVFEKHGDRFSEAPGYYVRATWDALGQQWVRREPLLQPDWRTGFPFVK